MRHRLSLAAIVAALFGVAGAQAQTPRPFFPLAGEEPTQSVATVPAGERSKIYLMSTGPMTFSEQGRTEPFAFALTERQDATLSIGYLTGSGLNVQNSRIEVVLNEHVVSSQPLTPESAGRLEVQVPAKMTRVGMNQVEIRVHQANGVCGVDSQVWTELRPAGTYVEVFGSAIDRNWVNPGPDAYVDAVILRSGDNAKASATAAVSAGMRLSNALARNRIRTSVIHDVADAPKNADLFVSTGPVEPGATINGVPMISVQQISGLHEDGFANVINASSAATLSFRDFGIVADGWTEVRHTNEMLIRLPDDFLSMTYGQMRFVVNGSSERPLDPRSTITIRVNRQIAATVSMPTNLDERGSFEFYVPMLHARPGLNYVEMIINTPGGSCGQSSGGRMALFGDSTVTFPPFGQAERTSITRLVTETPVNVVMNISDDAEVSLATAILMRLSRSAARVPDIEIVEPSSWLDDKNALIVSTGAPAYEPMFSLSSAEATRWRTAMNQRIDVISDQTSDSSETGTWAREMFAYRTLDSEVSPREEWLRQSLWAFSGGDGVSLRSDDTAFLVAKRGPGGGTHVLMSVASTKDWQNVSKLINESVLFAWDGRAAHIELDGELRSYRDYGLPTVKNMSIANLRLVIADVLSTTPLLFFAIIVIASTLLALATWALLPRKDR